MKRDRRRREPHSGVFLGEKQRLHLFTNTSAARCFLVRGSGKARATRRLGAPDTLARRRLGGRATRRARALYFVNHIEMLLVVLIVFVASFHGPGHRHEVAPRPRRAFNC